MEADDYDICSRVIELTIDVDEKFIVESSTRWVLIVETRTTEFVVDVDDKVLSMFGSRVRWVLNKWDVFMSKLLVWDIWNSCWCRGW